MRYFYNKQMELNSGVSRLLNEEWHNISYDSIKAQIEAPYYLSHIAVDPLNPLEFYVSSYYMLKN